MWAVLIRPAGKRSDRLASKIAIVTGAGSSGPGWGNGKAAAVTFARAGAQVFAVDIHLGRAEETAELIAAEGGSCVPFCCDVTDESSAREAAAACVSTFGAIHALQNNVGIFMPGGAVDTSRDSWQRVHDVNLTSAFLMTKAVLPFMLETGGGAIVNVSSVSGFRYTGHPHIAYASSKAALIQYTCSVALEFAPAGVRANVVVPGIVDTPMLRNMLGREDVDERLERMRERVPLGFLGDAWDVASASLFLCSDDARFITGAALVVDGGMSSRS